MNFDLFPFLVGFAAPIAFEINKKSLVNLKFTRLFLLLYFWITEREEFAWLCLNEH